ncbi:MAG TPA: hypothetical protein DDY37_08545 [Legionella sp.]|nr:hypothetical protein [Legionella sp.]
MKKFDVKPVVKWDRDFWVDVVPQLRLERLTAILEEASDSIPTLEQIKERFFTPIPDVPTIGLELIFNRMDREMRAASVDPLMRVVYSTILKLRYGQMDTLEACFAVVTHTLARKITLDLKIELLSDIWEQIAATEEDVARIAKADLFLHEIKKTSDASTLIAQLMQPQPKAPEVQATFLAFLLSPTLIDVTRFEQCIDLFNADDLSVFQFVERNALRKMFLVAELDGKCPHILQRAIGFFPRNADLVSSLWAHVVEPSIDTEHEVEKAFIAGLFSYDRVNGSQWAKMLSHLILTAPHFEFCLLTSNHIGINSNSMRLVNGLSIPLLKKRQIYTHFLGTIKGTDTKKAWDFIQTLSEVHKYSSQRVNGAMLLPVGEMTVLFQNIWNDIETKDRASFVSCLFFEHLEDENFAFNVEIVRSLMQMSPDFKKFLLSKEMNYVLIKHSQRETCIGNTLRSHLDLFCEQDSQTIGPLRPFVHGYLTEYLPKMIQTRVLDGKNTHQAKALFDVLKHFHPYLTNQAEGKKRVLGALNGILMNQEVIGHEKREALLNAMSTDRELCWFLLTYAYAVPAETVDNIYEQYAFLLKFRSLGTLTHFCEDAEHLQIHYPKAADSLIGLLNRTKVTKVDYLTLDPVLRLGQRAGLQSYLAPYVEYGGLFYTPPRAQQRIADGVSRLDPEQRKVYADSHPDAFKVPYTIVYTDEMALNPLEDNTKPAEPIPDGGLINSSASNPYALASAPPPPVLYAQPIDDEKPVAHGAPVQMGTSVDAYIMSMPRAPTGTVVFFPPIPEATICGSESQSHSGDDTTVQSFALT